jgi:molybdate transport system substrate-binding protein
MTRLATASLIAALAGGALAQTPRPAAHDELFRRLVAAAVDRAEVKVRYVPDYVRIPYPGGDVPADTGVCTDEIVRIYRKVGIDLQKELHEDLAAHFSAYPTQLRRPDPNIDHRRVPMLMTFFRRMGASRPITREPGDYRPGDVVAWDLVAGHVGMVIDRKDPTGTRHLILHNVGQGPAIEDVLFAWPIIGHYRWAGPGTRTLLAGAERSLAVAAAASLRPALEELARAFEAERPGVRVVLGYGASGVFFAQLRNGAPFDVFLSADREYPGRLVTAGLAAAADERVFAIGRLVVWLPPGSRVDLEREGLAALRAPNVKRIAIANPAVAPYGRAAEAALRTAGVLGAVRDRLVLGASVGQAAHFAATGAADAAFLPEALAREPELAGGRMVPVPESLHPRIEQSGVVLSSAREPELARAFLAFLEGEKGRAILVRHGYGVPRGPVQRSFPRP